MTLVLNGTTGVSSVDGSASTPAIQGTDSNTGVFFPAADTVAIATGGSERLRATSGGEVGIGTTSPGAKLGVGGGAGNAKIKLSNTASGSGSGDGFDLDFTGTDIYITNRENGFMAFENNGAERCRIDSSGNLLVNVTSQFNSGRQCLVFSGATHQGINIKNSADNPSDVFIGFYNAFGTNTGTIRSGGSTTSYNTSSDYRLKEDVQPMTGALAKVAALKPVTYKWKVDGSDGQGFIAHELAEVVPDAVVGEKDAVEEDGSIKPQGIDTSFLVATLTAAIQEQQALIESLTARIAALEAA